MTGELTPPPARTHLGLAMTAAATANSLQLQCCERCATVQYPPREVCRKCLSDDLTWAAINPAGTVMASSYLHHCLNPWFSERTPWLMGSVKLDCGPLVFAHLPADVAAAGSAVQVLGLKDASGQAVLVAISQSHTAERAQTLAQQLITRDLQEIT